MDRGLEEERPSRWRLWLVLSVLAVGTAGGAGIVLLTLFHRAGPSPQERLYSALLSTEPDDGRLPLGYRFVGSRVGTELGGRAADKVGEVVFDLEGPDLFNGVRYEVFGDEDSARLRFEGRVADAAQYSPETGAELFEPADIPHPALCIDDRYIGTECFALIREVIVQASAANDPPLGRLETRQHAVLLVKAAIDHLETLRTRT